MQETTLAISFALPAGLYQFPLTIIDQMPGFSKQIAFLPIFASLSSQGFWEDFCLVAHDKIRF